MLGEIYRLQKNTEQMDCTATHGQIYGLLNGFEESIDEQIAMIGHVSKDEVKSITRFFNCFFYFILSIVIPNFSCNILILCISACPTKINDIPDFPALAVLPLLCV